MIKRITILFLIVLNYISATPVSGQDFELEQRFLNERERIRKNKIFHIAERDCAYGGDCQLSQSDLKNEYFFDERGNLKTVKQYRYGSINVISYVPAETNGYISKTYKRYNDKGVIAQQKWLLTFNAKGQITKEELSGKTGIGRTNILEYDGRGNLVTKTWDRDRWTQTYNESGLMTEKREWRKNPKADTFSCIRLKTYEYTDRKLIHEIEKNPDSKEVWNDFTYLYDSNNYLVRISKRRTIWRVVKDSTPAPQIHESKEMFLNDALGSPVSTYSALEPDIGPLNRVFYIYNSSHASDSSFDFVKLNVKKVNKLIAKIKKHPDKPGAWLDKSRVETKKEDIKYSYVPWTIRGNSFYIEAKSGSMFVAMYRVDSKTYKLIPRK